MKIILEAQHACTATPRGVPTYTIQLIRHLLERKKNDYELSFFDGNHERNNRAWVDKYFGDFRVPYHECNSLGYPALCMDRNCYGQKSYNDYTGANGDIFHFMHIYSVPDRLSGEMVVTIHDMLPIRSPELFATEINEQVKINVERIIRIRPMIIAVSHATKEDIITYAGIAPEQIFVVPEAYDKNMCYPQKNTDQLRMLGIDSPYLLYLGAIDHRKNIIHIMEAFELITERYPDIKLVLSGKVAPNAAPIISKLESFSQRSKVILTGYVSDEQKRALLSGAEIFLFPSEYEGFGLPVLEAMACGAPVITTNISSLPEVGGDAAIYVSPNKPEQLAYEIERLLNSEALRSEFIQKGIARASEFSWNETARMTEEIYKITYERR